jgi:hypothetical protein
VEQRVGIISTGVRHTWNRRGHWLCVLGDRRDVWLVWAGNLSPSKLVPVPIERNKVSNARMSFYNYYNDIHVLKVGMGFDFHDSRAVAWKFGEETLQEGTRHWRYVICGPKDKRVIENTVFDVALLLDVVSEGHLKED